MASACFGPFLVPMAIVSPVSCCADPHGFEVNERLIAVIPLVADHFLQAVALGQGGFDLLGRG